MWGNIVIELIGFFFSFSFYVANGPLIKIDKMIDFSRLESSKTNFINFKKPKDWFDTHQEHKDRTNFVLNP